MPKTDKGFQGLRPGAFGYVWDRMTSPQRRFAFWSDVVVAIFGTVVIYGFVSWIS